MEGKTKSVSKHKTINNLAWGLDEENKEGSKTKQNAKSGKP